MVLTLIQLDAEILDSEVESLLNGQVKHVYTYLDQITPIFRSIQPELEAFIKYYIFKHTLFKNGSSLGQSMLELKLFSSKSLNDSLNHSLNTQSFTDFSLNPSKSQLFALGFITIGLPYLLERGRHLVPGKDVHRIELTLKGLNLLNFLIFLTNGRYRSLKERVLGLTCGYQSLSSAFNPVNYDFMSREVLWFTFAEFTSFTLPLINLTRIKNTFKRLISSSEKPVFRSGIRSKSDLITCAFCHETPINVREIGCNHVFCYYCIMIQLLADERNGVSCPECNFTTQNVSDVREVYMKGF